MIESAVDIILSCRNSQETIQECVESILNQTYENFNLFIFDDKSEDDTLEIAKQFKDNRITIISSKNNVGTYAAKNFVFLNHSKAKYVALHDADDVSLKDRLEKQVQFLINDVDNTVCVGTGVQEFWEMNNFTPHTNSDCLIDNNKRNNFYPIKITSHDIAEIYNQKNDYMSVLKTKLCMNGTVMFKREIIQSLGGWDGRTRFSGDSDIFIRALALGNIANIQEVLYRRRFHHRSLTLSSETGIKSDARETYNKMILEDVKLSMAGKVINRGFYYPSIESEVFSCVE